MTPSSVTPQATGGCALSEISSLFVADPDEMYGSAIERALVRNGQAERLLPSRGLDLRNSAAVDQFFAAYRPEVVYLAAGKKGGIAANQRCPAELMIDNLLVGSSVVQAAHRYGVKKLLYLASSCVYPRDCPQPMQESQLLSGPFEPTSEAYSTAKLANLRLCQAYRRQYGCDFVVAIPTNIYGPGDNFDPENAHVVGALIQRITRARDAGVPAVEIWGTGAARREFLYVEDFGEACVFLADHYQEAEPINIASGTDVSIRELAFALREIIGFRGELRFDSSKPDGAPRKALDGSRLDARGWRPKTSLTAGLEQTVYWFNENVSSNSPQAPRKL